MQISPALAGLGCLGSLLAGYGIFRAMLGILPQRLKNERDEQLKLEKKSAERRKAQIAKESKLHFEAKLKLSQETLESSLVEQLESLKVSETELEGQEVFLQELEQRTQKSTNESESAQKKLQNIKNQHSQLYTQRRELENQIQTSLATAAEMSIDTEKQKLREHWLNQRQIDAQKRLKDLTEDLGASSKRQAERFLVRALSRYQPQFFWPKALTQVDLKDPRQAAWFSQPETRLLEDLKELTEGVDISLVNDEEAKLPYIKVLGGYGIYKEAARLTLEELLHRGPNHFAQVSTVYQKHRQQLEHQALRLGRQAIRELNLKPMREDILKMIGALNWRTSYRQNQYFHSLEVARLAGMVAQEFKLDAELAKRSGILHDIGKTIDYRIEGSHAVISGDYADRFGESRLVCDIVMSHHNDLVVETPHAYLLKTADTLSGARPGARVNLEEGYQIRLSAIEQAVRSFPGVIKIEIMNGGREVHVDVNHKKVRDESLERLSADIARKIEIDVAYPGQIKVIVSRRFEVVAVA